MYMLKVVIVATNTAQPVIPHAAGVRNSNTMFQTIVPQNNGVNVIWLGDATVATNNGLQLPPSSSVGSMSAALPPGDLKDFYLYGTAGDFLNILVFP